MSGAYIFPSKHHFFLNFKVKVKVHVLNKDAHFRAFRLIIYDRQGIGATIISDHS